MRKINLLPLFSCIGVAVTGYLAYRNAEKIKSTLYCAKEEEFKDKETNIDLLKAAAPPLIAGAATCVCVIVHGRATAKQIASLGAGCAFLYKKYKMYREKVRDICGEEVDRKIIAEIAKDDWQVYPAIPCFDDEQKMLFYDAFSERFFYATYDRVQQALYHINRNLQLRGDTTINEFYDFIGIEPVFYGEKQAGINHIL